MKTDSERSVLYNTIAIFTVPLPAVPFIMTVLGMICGYRALKTEADEVLIRKAKLGITLGYVSIALNVIYTIFAFIVVFVSIDFLANVFCGLNGGTDCNFIIQY